MCHKFLLPAILCLVFSASPAFGQQQRFCVVTLKNGNTIEAKSCHEKGHRIYLKFALGEASFNLSEVKSITGGSGISSLFRDKGTYQPPSPGEEAGSAGPDYAVDPAQAEREKKFNEFFNKYWQADTKTQGKMDKRMDKVFDDYFKTPSPEKSSDK